MQKYKDLLFDADGTLLDFSKTEDLALKLTFRKYGIHLTPEMKALYIDINRALWTDFEQGLIDKETVVETRFSILFKELSLNIDPIAFEADYQPTLGSGAYLMNGAYEICQYLKPFFNLYIVTNGVSSTQYSRLNSSGLCTLMQNFFVSEDIGTQKPNVDYFKYVFDHIPDFSKEKTLIIGDSLTSDIAGGNRAGIDTCWYNPNRIQPLDEILISYEIHELEELKTLLF